MMDGQDWDLICKATTTVIDVAWHFFEENNPGITPNCQPGCACVLDRAMFLTLTRAQAMLMRTMLERSYKPEDLREMQEAVTNEIFPISEVKIAAPSSGMKH